MVNIHVLSVGQVVYSKCGRDKGLPFIITALDGDFVMIADGETRRLEKPKKKKLKHLRPVKYISETIKTAIAAKRHIENADIRKALTQFKSEQANQ